MSRWDTGGVTTASSATADRHALAVDAREALSQGLSDLATGWEGVAADAVLDAVDTELRRTAALTGHLDDLTRTLEEAARALGPAVQVVRARIADAQAQGLVVLAEAISPAPGRGDIPQVEVDAHAAAIEQALRVVASLDQLYGSRLDEIASRLSDTIPPEVDRGPIPGPDGPRPGAAFDALTAAMSAGLPSLADELDPLTRGRHALNTLPDDYGRLVSSGLRFVGKLAGPLGSGVTMYDGLNRYARGEGSAVEIATETSGALGGGMVGGAAFGAVGGSRIGPHGALIGAGAGAAIGSPMGKKFCELAYKSVTEHHDLLLRQYHYAI